MISPPATVAAQLQERFHTDNNQYAATVQALGYATTATSPQGYWALSVTNATAVGFTAVAQPTGTHADADCTSITLNAQGVEGAAPSPVDDCW